MAQQNEKQPKAKTGLARCLELASGHKGLVFLAGFFYQGFWLHWQQFVLLHLIYQFITSFGKSCLFTRICRS